MKAIVKFIEPEFPVRVNVRSRSVGRFLRVMEKVVWR